MALTSGSAPKFKVWGCRGSIPVSGPEFVRHGGATTAFCVEGPEGRLLLDAGSGLQAFGARGGVPARDATLMISHFHSDHLSGFPFYRHLFDPEWNLEVASVPRNGLTAMQAMTELHRQPYFPVPLKDSIRARVRELSLPESGSLERAGVKVEWMEIAHPGGASAYRITGKSKSIVIATDIELRKLPDEGFLNFARNADYALLDSQFTDAEYSRFEGWGHSTAEDCARFAQQAGIQTLYLTHHDPTRTDGGVDALVASAREIFPNTHAAFEGLELVLD